MEALSLGISHLLGEGSRSRCWHPALGLPWGSQHAREERGDSIAALGVASSQWFCAAPVDGALVPCSGLRSGQDEWQSL